MKRKHPDEQTFFEHLEELRHRLVRAALLWLLVFVVCFLYVKPIFNFLAEPLILARSTPHVFGAVDLKEPFMANLKAAFWVSVIFSSPILFYHFWAFVSPGLTRDERRFAVPMLVFMALFFMVGCFFSFTQVFSYALEYLIGWNEQGFDAYTRTSYLSLLFAFVIGMGASFEMPLVIFFLAKIGLVTPRFLISKFKYAVLLIFTLAAIITPTPDVWMQTFLAGPMLVLYWMGVGAAVLVTRKKGKKEEGEEGEEPAVDEETGDEVTPEPVEGKKA